MPSARRQLHRSSIGLVEALQSAGDPQRPVTGFSSDYQVAFPYAGLFRWHVGTDDVVGDANQILFVRGGEPYRVTQPRRGVYAELIVTPAPALLADLLGTCEHALTNHELFRARSCAADSATQRARALLMAVTSAADPGEPLEIDERTVALLRFALGCRPGDRRPGAVTAKLIGRTKEYIDADLCRRLRLDDIATAVGASPAYLTDVFRRFEGRPLHRYVTDLRLSRALTELPHARDLTSLALGLGFSSHSHFTSAFRQRFGIPPSAFRRFSKPPEATTPEAR